MLQKGIKGRLQRSICAGEVCNGGVRRLNPYSKPKNLRRHERRCTPVSRSNWVSVPSEVSETVSGTCSSSRGGASSGMRCTRPAMMRRFSRFAALGGYKGMKGRAGVATPRPDGVSTRSVP